MKAQELTNVQEQMDQIHLKAGMFNVHFDTVRNTVMETMQSQLKEYMTSINNKPNFGIDARLPF